STTSSHPRSSTSINNGFQQSIQSSLRNNISFRIFLGNTEVDQPKGIEVVKEGIRKLKFNQQLRKAEGNKTPKVELTISIDGVAIQEPKTKRIMHQYPLHRISYCADDKGEKRFFSFIAKEADSERHICYVFVSDKLAEEITLTIGQAFDLAYRRFLETSGKDLEVQRRLILLQQKVKRLEAENSTLRQRLSDVAQIKGQGDIEEYMSRNAITDLLSVSTSTSSNSTMSPSSNDFNYSSDNMNGGLQQSKENGNLLNLSSCSTGSSNGISTPPAVSLAQPPPVPPRAFEATSSKAFGEDSFISDMLSTNQPSVGTKLEGLLLNELDEDDFNPRAYECLPSNNNSGNVTFNTNGSTTSPPLLAPPPKSSDPFKEDLFGSTPFNPASSSAISCPPTGNSFKTDPFGMGDFGNHESGDPSQQELENAIGILDKRLLEMKDGFSRGLSFGNDDFSLESLDPLRKS
ncbi:hypothetical protein L9F63_002185, partial [Diploptera punctata]